MGDAGLHSPPLLKKTATEPGPGEGGVNVPALSNIPVRPEYSVDSEGDIPAFSKSSSSISTILKLGEIAGLKNSTEDKGPKSAKISASQAERSSGMKIVPPLTNIPPMKSEPAPLLAGSTSPLATSSLAALSLNDNELGQAIEFFLNQTENQKELLDVSSESLVNILNAYELSCKEVAELQNQVRSFRRLEGKWARKSKVLHSKLKKIENETKQLREGDKEKGRSKRKPKITNLEMSLDTSERSCIKRTNHKTTKYREERKSSL
mmetsp:Transcript_36847/g.92349  ORF Transcript_36847/g.92349 Transcript_36847/m.92349 type:complete len:264 (-) Transcript_36847:203-994(-)